MSTPSKKEVTTTGDDKPPVISPEEKTSSKKTIQREPIIAADSIVDAMSLINIDLVMYDTMTDATYTFLTTKMEIYDVMDIIDIAKSPYHTFKKSFGSELYDAVAPTITDIKLLAEYLFDRHHLDDIIQQHENDTETGWKAFFADKKYHMRHFHRYHTLQYPEEYAKAMHESLKDTPGAKESERKSPTVTFQDSPATIFTPARATKTPKTDLTMKTTTKSTENTASTRSNIAINTTQLEEEASYQQAMTTLNESFINKPATPVALVNRRELRNKVTWDGEVKTFRSFKFKYESYLLQSEQAYVCKLEFREAYMKGGTPFLEQCAKNNIRSEQVLKDTIHQFGSLMQACCDSPATRRFFTKKNKDDGIRVWHAMLEWFDVGGNVINIITEIQSNLAKEYHDKFPGGITGFLTHVANEFARQEELITEHPDCEVLIPTDAMKMAQVMALFQRSQYNSTVYDIHKDCKKDGATFEDYIERIRNKFAYVDEGHASNAKRYARVAVYEPPPTPSVLEQSMPFMAHISRSDPRYLQPDLYNLMQRMDRAFARRFMDERNKLPAPPKKHNTQHEQDEPAKPSPAPLPKQYMPDTRKADHVQQEEVDDASTGGNGMMDDPFQDLDSLMDDLYGGNDNADRQCGRTITVRPMDPESFKHLQPRDRTHFRTISDCGADTWIVGQGWRILATTNRVANVIGFDSQNAKKRNLPIVVAGAVTKDSEGNDVLLVVFECVYNKSSSFSLMSEFQTRELGNLVDSVPTRHLHFSGKPGMQGMKLLHPFDQESTNPPVIPFDITQALMTFQHRYPSDDDLQHLPRFQMTPSDKPWSPQQYMTSLEPILEPCNTPIQMAYHVTQSFITLPSPFTPLSPPDLNRSVKGGGSIGRHNDSNSSIASCEHTNLDDRGDNTSNYSNSACFTSIPVANNTLCDIPIDEIVIPNPEGNTEATYYFDPTDTDEDTQEAPLLTLDATVVDQWLDQLDDDELYGKNEPFDTFAFGLRAAINGQQATALQPYLGYRPIEVIRRTIECTTQLGATINYHHLRAHLKSLLPWANKPRIDETVSTDTIFSDTRDVSGSVCAQIFYGLKSHVINVYGMRTESDGPQILDDFIRSQGIPSVMRSDNARMQRYGKSWLQRLRDLLIHAEFSEPYNQQQNPVELRAIRWLKDAHKVLSRRTGAPREVWLEALQYLADIHNITADETLGWRTPKAMREGTQPDISQFLQFQFWEPVMYLDSEQKFPSTKERKGRWVGIAPNVGDFFCWKIYDEETEGIVERSVVKSRWKSFGMPYESAVYDDDECDDPVFAPKSIPIRHDQARKERIKEKRRIREQEQKERRAKRKNKDIDVNIPQVPIPDIAPVTTPETQRAELVIDETVRLLNGGQEQPIQEPVANDADVMATSELENSNIDENADPIVDTNEDVEVQVDDEPISIANLSAPEPSPRKDPILPKPMLTEMPLALRRSQRNVTKPARFRAMLAMHATMLMLPLIPIAAILMPTHEVIPMVPMVTKPNVQYDLLEPDEIFQIKYQDTVQCEYVRLCDQAVDAQDQDDQVWKPVQMLGHSVRKRKERVVMAKVKWKDGDTSWIHLSALKIAEPILIVQYVRQKPTLIHSSDFNWIKDLIQDRTALTTMVKAFKARVENEPRIKFGVKVPYSIRQALQFDKDNGNHLWFEAIQKELTQIHDYKTFRLLTALDNLAEYTQIPYHFVFDVKFDGRRKARLVAGGNHTEPSRESVFSGVVNIASVRLGFLLAKLNDLQVCAADIGNAFLYGKTREKVYIKAGREFGDMCGQILIIDKGLYGLRTSSARFHEHLSTKMKLLGYTPSRADADLWIKDVGTHYEYIARYVDDIIAFGKDPLQTINEFKKIYILKGIGSPEYYLGGDVVELDNTWHKQNVQTALSAHTYATNVVQKFETLLQHEFRKYNSPMDQDYHPETDTSDFLNPKDVTLYRGLIGSANWMITLGRFDIAYATNSLARFNAKPREGHLRAMYRLFGYVKQHTRGQIIVDSNYMDWSKFETEDQDWSEFYPDAVEELPPDMPIPKGRSVRITCFKDADHAHDLVTRRSVTGVLLFANSMPLEWLSKRQKTVETSTYGSELVAARIATDLIVAYRYKLRMLGVPVDGPALLLGDNASVIASTMIPSSPLRKKHNAIAYHRVREAIAAKIIRLAKIDSKDNISDCLTKPLGPEAFRRLVKRVLFRSPLGPSLSTSAPGTTT